MRAITLTVVLLGCAACGGDTRPLDAPLSNGPDASLINPVDPLVIPGQLDLPQPTPGGPNLADRN